MPCPPGGTPSVQQEAVSGPALFPKPGHAVTYANAAAWMERFHGCGSGCHVGRFGTARQSCFIIRNMTSLGFFMSLTKNLINTLINRQVMKTIWGPEFEFTAKNIQQIWSHTVHKGNQQCWGLKWKMLEGVKCRRPWALPLAWVMCCRTDDWGTLQSYRMSLLFIKATTFTSEFAQLGLNIDS